MNLNSLSNFWQHPRTTLSAAALAVLQVLLNGRSGRSVALACAMAALGAISRDPAPSTPPK
jgi:hypothetical protein